MKIFRIYRHTSNKVIVTEGDNTGLRDNDFVTSIEANTASSAVTAWVRRDLNPGDVPLSVYADSPNERKQYVVEYYF